MRIYVDCCLCACTPSAREEFDRRIRSFEDFLRQQGFKPMDFSTPDLPFNPYEAEVADFVRIADVVVALGSYPSRGFGEPVIRASEKHLVPRVIFTKGPHDHCERGASALQIHCTVSSGDFPLKVLRNTPTTISRTAT